MPEGPECHAAAAFLRRQCVGHRLTAMIILHGRYMKKDPKGWDMLRCRLRQQGGPSVDAVRVHGKMIYLVLSGGLCIVTTLGLTGKWQTRCAKHTGICIVMDKGRLWFKDQLHYGTLSIITEEECEKRVARLGPDCTLGTESVDVGYWLAACEKHQEKQVSVLLMNQNVIAGIGNYLKNEVLHAAGVHPCTVVGTLSPEQQTMLLHHALAVTHLWWRYKMRLSSKRPRMHVYRRKKAPNGDDIRKVKASDGRTSHTTLPPPRSPRQEPDATAFPSCQQECIR